MEMTVYWSVLIPLVILCSLLSYHCTHGKLQIRRVDSPIEVPPGHNTTLPCLFHGYEASSLVLSIVGVRWNLRTLEEKEKEVYLFNGGNRTQYRPGSHIPDSGLIGGDGSLYISNIQPSDEGEYTCSVYVTPEKAIRKVTMKVSAVPTCTVSDSRLKMHPNTERSVTCYVSGFYPETVRIRWVKHGNDSLNKAKMDNRTYTSIPVQNHDGTYIVRSLVSVRPMSTEEDGDVYSCVITHRSLRDPLTCDVTLSVKPIKGDSTGITVVITYMVLLIIAGIYIYKNVLLRVSEITKNGSDTILVCRISGFRPQNLVIKLYWQEDSGTRTTRHEVDSWRLRDNGEKDELLHTKDSADLYLDPVVMSDTWLHFHCVCLIHLSQHISDEKWIILEVHHKVLRLKICKLKKMLIHQ
ncbi:natural cytotoxicity triggering receptor 3 ligand 1-like isoform X2 [Dendropsophus ebraccatus]|uniref:natural cytotoxicity triggering receptor 3 ligand 1-like isoform X2 n=1 Tax=Dendropsophus ebraccatus TaxID=150705 RepID=UPI0038321B4F